MLQDERGYRVQLMKDTTKPNEYSAIDVTLQRGQDANGNDVDIQHSTDNTKLIMSTGSDGGATTAKLRTGLKVAKVGLTNSGQVALGNVVKIVSIEPSVPSYHYHNYFR